MCIPYLGAILFNTHWYTLMCMRPRDIKRMEKRDLNRAIKNIHTQLHGILLMIPCRVCNRVFSRKRSDARYCSSKCRQKAYRLRANGYQYYLDKNEYCWINGSSYRKFRYTYDKFWPGKNCNMGLNLYKVAIGEIFCTGSWFGLSQLVAPLHKNAISFKGDISGIRHFTHSYVLCLCDAYWYGCRTFSGNAITSWLPVLWT